MSNWPQPYAPDPRLPATHVYLPPAHKSSTAHLVIAWLAALLSAGYMLPWAIGATRNRTNCVGTALVNFFFGWTLIGWVIALVMACGSEPQQPVIVQTFPGHPYAPGAPPYAGPGYHPAPNAAYPGYPVQPNPTHTFPAALPPAPPTAAEVTMPLPTYRPDARPPRGLR